MEEVSGGAAIPRLSPRLSALSRHPPGKRFGPGDVMALGAMAITGGTRGEGRWGLRPLAGAGRPPWEGGSLGGRLAGLAEASQRENDTGSLAKCPICS